MWTEKSVLFQENIYNSDKPAEEEDNNFIIFCETLTKSALH